MFVRLGVVLEHGVELHSEQSASVGNYVGPNRNPLYMVLKGLKY